jgi:hypothetical protein
VLARHHAHEVQAVGIRVALHRLHIPDKDLIPVVPDAMQRLDLDPRQRQARRQLARLHLDIDEIPKPG